MNNLQHIRSMAEMILKQVDELEGEPLVAVNTPTPAKPYPKFSVGDRVQTRSGTEGVVTAVYYGCGGHCYDVQYVESKCPISGCYLESELHKVEAKPKFKVGDRVNVSRSRVCNDYDYTGTVADVQPGPVGYVALVQPDSDEQIDYWWSENVLTLSKEAKPKFKVGDKVVWRSDTVEKVLTIVRVGHDQFNMDAHAAGRVTFPNETGVYFQYDVTSEQGGISTFGEAALEMYDQPNADGIIWHSGPPPHVGWWNASTVCNTETWRQIWRWWDGKCWSASAYPTHSMATVNQMANWKTDTDYVKWTDYWPENARVPRIVPDVHLAKNNYKAYYHWHDTNTFEIWHLDPVTGDVTKV